GNPSKAVPSNLDLFYDKIFIGHISGVFHSDNTWYGVLEKAKPSTEDCLIRRLFAFLSFSEQWKERNARNPSKPPAPTAFDQYSDLLTSGLWFTRSAQGDIWHVAEAPVFFPGGDVTWRAS